MFTKASERGEVCDFSKPGALQCSAVVRAAGVRLHCRLVHGHQGPHEHSEDDEKALPSEAVWDLAEGVP